MVSCLLLSCWTTIPRVMCFLGMKDNWFFWLFNPDWLSFQTFEVRGLLGNIGFSTLLSKPSIYIEWIINSGFNVQCEYQIKKIGKYIIVCIWDHFIGSLKYQLLCELPIIKVLASIMYYKDHGFNSQGICLLSY